jgi:hypothetical protein
MCWDHSNDEFMDYPLVVFMIYKEEGGGSPQIEVDIQRRLIVHVTMYVITPTLWNVMLIKAISKYREDKYINFPITE